MVKQLILKTGSINDSTLVILGWAAFFSSYYFVNPALAIVLQSVARVLP